MLQNILRRRKDFSKAVILGMQFAKHNKQEAIKTGYASGLKGEPDVVNRAYDLFSLPAMRDRLVCRSGWHPGSCSTKISAPASSTKTLRSIE